MTGWTHLERVQREQTRQRLQATSDAISRDCAQLGREQDAFYLKVTTLTKKKDWSDEDFQFARHAAEKLKSFETRYAAIQRRCREFNAARARAINAS